MAEFRSEGWFGDYVHPNRLHEVWIVSGDPPAPEHGMILYAEIEYEDERQPRDELEVKPVLIGWDDFDLSTVDATITSDQLDDEGLPLVLHQLDLGLFQDELPWASADKKHFLDELSKKTGLSPSDIEALSDPRSPTSTPFARACLLAHAHHPASGSGGFHFEDLGFEYGSIGCVQSDMGTTAGMVRDIARWLRDRFGIERLPSLDCIDVLQGGTAFARRVAPRGAPRARAPAAPAPVPVLATEPYDPAVDPYASDPSMPRPYYGGSRPRPPRGRYSKALLRQYRTQTKPRLREGYDYNPIPALGGPLERRIRLLRSRQRRHELAARRAYEAGDLVRAENEDALADAAAKELESVLEHAEEDTEATVVDDEPWPSDFDPDVVEGEPVDYLPGPEIEQELAALYYDYVQARQGTPSVRSRFYGEADVERQMAELVRHVLVGAGPVRQDATDRELIDAAADAYDAYSKRRRRQRQRLIP